MRWMILLVLYTIGVYAYNLTHPPKTIARDYCYVPFERGTNCVSRIPTPEKPYCPKP